MPKYRLRSKFFLGASLLALGSGPALADLSAPEIWADWQAFNLRLGGEMTATQETYADGTLTLEGVTVTSTLNDVQSAASYGTIALVEQPDGSIHVGVPQTLASRGETTVEGMTITQTGTIENEGLSIVIREDGAARIYDIVADAIRMQLSSQAEVGGNSMPETVGQFDLEGFVTQYRSGLGADGNDFISTFAADSAIMRSDAPMTADSDAAQFEYTATGLVSTSSGTLGPAPEGPVSGLSDMALTFTGDVTHSGSTMSIETDSPQGPFTLTGSSGSGTLAFGMNGETLDYTLSSRDGTLLVETANFPVPIQMTLTEASSQFALPYGTPGDEQPFALQLALRDLEVDDLIWGLFDPTGQLPRTPVNVVLDLDGTAVMAVDLLGGTQSMVNLDGPPGQPRSLTLNDLLVEFGGASLRGTGDLTFAESASPLPEPLGQVNLALDGGFALVDSLVALGFVPAGQASFLKGMSGMVARPVGDDMLESTIEFTPGGGISANGMPLK